METTKLIEVREKENGFEEVYETKKSIEEKTIEVSINNEIIHANPIEVNINTIDITKDELVNKHNLFVQKILDLDAQNKEHSLELERINKLIENNNLESDKAHTILVMYKKVISNNDELSKSIDLI